MEPSHVHVGRTALVPMDHVDTDRIIPARYLSRIERAGYGGLLFADVRGADFPLDQPEAAGASVLVVGTNFGCGSSREHAVWAIQQAGYRVVIARQDPDSPGYSDIFRQNAANCGLLLIDMPTGAWGEIAAVGSGVEATVDLPAQRVSLGGRTWTFAIDAGTKDQLLRGLDLVGTTLLREDEIARYESDGRVTLPGAASSHL